jgi:hypothetical protein
MEGGNTITLANVDFDDDLDLVVGNYQGSGSARL